LWSDRAVSPRIAKIKDAIEVAHQCTARHVDSTPVTEAFREKVVWTGVVETFELGGHPQATRCHAWNYDDEKGGTQEMTVLEIPPVVSPETAVKVAIAAVMKARTLDDLKTFRTGVSQIFRHASWIIMLLGFLVLLYIQDTSHGDDWGKPMIAAFFTATASALLAFVCAVVSLVLRFSLVGIVCAVLALLALAPLVVILVGALRPVSS
jgi:hypothetical protein